MSALSIASEAEGPRRPASSSSVRLAVIDDDSGYLQVLGKRLEAAGWPYRVLASAVPTDHLVSMRLNAVVVDLACLGSQGWDYLERLCTQLPGLGIIVCTGPSTVAQRVRGLRMGADDWIAKPCHPEEVVARVEAVVRRRKRSEPVARTRPAVQAGELDIRPDLFQVFVAGVGADLTRREFELIQLLAGVPGQVLEREEIYQRVWGYAMAHGDRSVDVFVRKLRQKLQRISPEWRYIHTHFGIGYRFAPSPLAAAAVEQEIAAGDHGIVEAAGISVAGGGSEMGSAGEPALAAPVD